MSELDTKPVKLTQTVKKGGCAAKLPATELKKVLSNLKLEKNENLIVGTEHMDDACVWDLNNGSCMIQTLDFFTPIVDDPYDFGAIAAANSLSDVYAMGGEPKVVLSILAYPTLTLEMKLLEPMMKGALDKIHEAGAVLAGGHSIDDETLKLGFSVTGFAEKKNIWSNKNAKVGDVLVLTKPIGTGTITSALKKGECPSDWVQAAVGSMKTLNKVPELLQLEDVHAATDITGFGLAGHVLQMALASGVNIQINANEIPVLPGTKELLEKGILNRAHATNWEYVQNDITMSDEKFKTLLVDPQTSGGLLLSVPKDKLNDVLSRIKKKFPYVSVIGVVQPLQKSSCRLHVCS